MANVLVVDDDPLIIVIVTKVLKNAGHTAFRALNGHDALELVAKHKFDLVITDVNMPDMSGWALIRELRTAPDTAFLPVIFLTSLSSAEDRVKGFRLGADDYLAKPFSGEELILRIENTLRKAGGLKKETKQGMVTSGFRGSLDQIGLSSLLLMLDLEKKSGELALTRPGESARFLLRNGQVISAVSKTHDDGEVRGAECVYRVLTWPPDGHFNFDRKEIDAPNEVNASINSLLMEGARRIDEKAMD